MNETQASISTQTNFGVKIEFCLHDKGVLRCLAGKMSELASRTIEEEKRKLWYMHNDLKESRPVIFCDPENGWNEIITKDELECRGDLARKWEMILRKEIFWGQLMGDDKVIEPYFNVPYVYYETDWGMREIKVFGGNGGSYTWDAPLKSYDDLEKLHFPKITIDHGATQKMLELAEKTIGDLLTVRIKGTWWWSLGMTWQAINLRGLEQFMVDMYDNPSDVHRFMSILRDGHLAKLDFLQENGLLSLNNDGTYVGSGGFGYTRQLPQEDYDGKRVRTCDMWGFGESQETCYVSPDMFKEFIFPYQLSILERFGLNCYGCCEPLDGRWDIVKEIPNLRRVSVSPWANFQKMAENLGQSYIYSFKPNPAHLAVPELDEEVVRKELRSVLEVTRDCRVEIIMKDNHTIGNNPKNVIKWCQIAREEGEKRGN